MAEPIEVSERKILYAMQSGFGTPAATTDNTAKYIRRTSFSLGHTRATIESNEKRVSRQKIYQAHGLNATAPTVSGELYPGAWEDFFEALLARDFTTVATITASSGDEFSISSGVLIRAGSSASWWADGLTVGTIIELGASPQAGNEGRNVLVYGFNNSKEAKVVALSGAPLVDSATDANMTVTIRGKKTFIPTSSFTKKYMTIEDRRGGTVDASVVLQDLLVNSLTITMAANQIVTLEWGLVGGGKVLEKRTTASPYFTSPVAPDCGDDGFALSRGLLYLGGSALTVLTTLTITITWNAVAPEVAFSQTSPTVARSNNVTVTFSGGALQDGTTVRDQFVNESYSPLILALETVSGEACSMVIGRPHFNSNDPDDGDTFITESFDGEALEACSIDGFDHTVFMIQDTSLS